MGIGQLQPATVDFTRMLIGIQLDPNSANDNIRMSAWFLRYLLDRTGNNVSVSVAAYYQGLRSVTTGRRVAETLLYVATCWRYARRSPDRATFRAVIPQLAQRSGDASCRRRLIADRPVDELANEVGVAVVARVLLDHVDVDPAQRARLAVADADVVERVLGGHGRGCVALRLPRRKVVVPVGSSSGTSSLSSMAGRTRCSGARVAQQHPAEPVAFHLGHVSHEAVERQ